MGEWLRGNWAPTSQPARHWRTASEQLQNSKVKGISFAQSRHDQFRCMGTHSAMRGCRSAMMHDNVRQHTFTAYAVRQYRTREHQVIHARVSMRMKM